MRTKFTVSTAIGAGLILISSACHNREAAPVTNTQPPPAAAQNASQAPPGEQRNANVTKESATPPKQNKEPAQLLGEYEAREIEDKGVVTLVSSIQTKFYFFADGSYSRASKKDGRVYHTDSGNYRIEPPDRLVLTIQLSGTQASQNIQNPPLVKSHKFTLSPDGDELRLISDKGSVAVYHRVSKPASQ
jgi:hypothetical protein